MSTEFILQIGNTDFSAYLTENDLTVKYTPVYDESSEFVAMDGSTHRTLLGYKVSLAVMFSTLDEAAASSLSGILSSEKVSVAYLFPDVKSADFTLITLELEPLRENVWSAYISMISDLIPLDGL